MKVLFIEPPRNFWFVEIQKHPRFGINPLKPYVITSKNVNKVAKKTAYKVWQKLGKIEHMETLLPTLLDAIEKQEQAKRRAKANNEFIPEWPHAATWLNGRRWEDELEIKKRWDHAG